MEICPGALSVDNSCRMMKRRKALRRLACEGRLSKSSQGELSAVTKFRLSFVPFPKFDQRVHPQVRWYTARLVQMLRTCCCPVPQTSLTSWKSCSIVARSAKASWISCSAALGSVQRLAKLIFCGPYFAVDRDGARA